MNEEMSKDLYERAVKHMPGGVNSPVRAYKAVDLSLIHISEPTRPY